MTLQEYLTSLRHKTVAVIGIGVSNTPLLRLLQVPDDVFPLALLYLRIYLAGMPVILLYNFEAAIFRSVGETKIPLIALASSGVLNVLLNLFFVAVLHRTVDGVAIATVISNAVSSVLLYRRLRRTNLTIRLEPKQLRIDFAILKRILSIGLPAGVQSAVFAFSNIVIQSAINSLGTEVMAASSAAMSLEYVCYNLLNSFSQACTTFVGQNHGARQIGRCTKTLKVCLVEGGIVALTTIIVIVGLGREILSLFNSDPNIVSIGYFQSVERPRPAMAVTVLRGFVFMAACFFGLPLLLGVEGIWLAVPLAEALTFAVVAAIYGRTRLKSAF